VRAVVLDADGQPRLAETPAPAEPMRVLAVGLCGSDVEKIGRAPAGTVLGHEVVARRGDGSRIALFHHVPCGKCKRCSAGHESTCEAFSEQTIVPGGFAVGRLFSEVLSRRGDEVFALDTDPRRTGQAPDGPVDAAVLCAPAAPLDAVAAGGTVLVFAASGQVDLDEVYRRELTLTGSRSATPRHMEEAAALLPGLDLPQPIVLPLARFAEGLALYRSGGALKIVFAP